MSLGLDEVEVTFNDARYEKDLIRDDGIHRNHLQVRYWGSC